MSDIHQFTSVTFRNYKALKRYSVSLREFNVLVGPNNSGKSTIIGAFRILAEGMRKASARKPERIHIPGEHAWGYRVPLEDLPVATENIFSNYDDSESAVVEFRFSSGNALSLIFPRSNLCYLVCKTIGRSVRSPSDFKREFKSSIGFVPVLGPVEHDEPLYQKEAARKALLTHRASRNFRNIWYHYPDDFVEFRELIRSTWPGMDIERPEIDYKRRPPVLHMFCPEERFPREIFWAGFGFQVWCQMLTYIVRASIGLDVLIATHSTEIISEADPGDLLVINKKTHSAKRIKDPSQLLGVFSVLGSNLNPTLTQLAKCKRVVFVEGKDFQIFSAFARKLGKQAVANRSDFAIIPLEGFNPQKVNDLSKGIELTLGGKLLKAVIFDRDYRSADVVTETKSQLSSFANLVHIHAQKEIENYLLDPIVLDRALQRRIAEHNKRANTAIECSEKIEDILTSLTGMLKSKVSGQFLSSRSSYEKIKNSSLDQATINQRLLDEFEEIWSNLHRRLEIVPGKEILSQLNAQLQERYKVTLSVTTIIGMMRPEEVPKEIIKLIDELDSFRIMVV